MNIQVFSDVTPRRLVKQLKKRLFWEMLDSEEEGTTILRNVGKYLKVHMS
jgi:hypothetical protein